MLKKNPLKKPFDPGGSGVFQNDPAHILRAHMSTECFDEDENNENDLLWPSHFQLNNFENHQ